MNIRTARRTGVTLTEVLVALFVMALGMLALLTLFPLGAMQIGQALKDDRTAQCALEADAYMRIYWQHEVVEKWDSTDPMVEPDPFVWAFDDVTATAKPTPPVPPAVAPPRTKDASYPVLIDPLSYYMTGRTGNAQKYVAGVDVQTLPRRSLRSITTKNDAFQHFAMTDDIWFEANGVPDSTAGLRRQGRYNWAIMLQRDHNNDPLKANMKVLVFDGRLPFIAPANEEHMVSVTAASGQRQMEITLPFTPGDNDAPLIRIGGWLMDGTQPAMPTDKNPRRADFYRITGVTQDSATHYFLDIDRPLLHSNSTTRDIYFFAGLAEVFDRHPLQPTPTN